MHRPGRAVANINWSLGGSRISANPVEILRGQRGFSLVRALAVLAVLVGILLVPIWQNREAKKTAKPTSVVRPNASAPTVVQPGMVAATAAATAPAAAATGASASPTANPDRLGLSFGHGKLPSTSGPALMFSACAGEPKDGPNTGQGPCNTQVGDQSCRTALPVLCVLKDGGAVTETGLPADTPLASAEGGTATFSLGAAWVGGALGATAPVAGFVLGSLAQAHARCAAELGQAWRMAQAQDSALGTSLIGKRGPGLTATNTRHWVHTSEHPAHCWDPS